MDEKEKDQLVITVEGVSHIIEMIRSVFSGQEAVRLARRGRTVRMANPTVRATMANDEESDNNCLHNYRRLVTVNDNGQPVYRCTECGHVMTINGTIDLGGETDARGTDNRSENPEPRDGGSEGTDDSISDTEADEGRGNSGERPDQEDDDLGGSEGPEG